MEVSPHHRRFLCRSRVQLWLCSAHSAVPPSRRSPALPPVASWLVPCVRRAPTHPSVLPSRVVAVWVSLQQLTGQCWWKRRPNSRGQMLQFVPSLADTKGSVSFILQGIKGWSWWWHLCADLCEAAKSPVPLLASRVFVWCCVPPATCPPPQHNQLLPWLGAFFWSHCVWR